MNNRITPHLTALDEPTFTEAHALAAQYGLTLWELSPGYYRLECKLRGWAWRLYPGRGTVIGEPGAPLIEVEAGWSLVDVVEMATATPIEERHGATT